MNTEQLIRELGAELRPVKPVRPPGVRFLRWGAFTLAWIAACSVVVGAHVDFVTWRNPALVFGIAWSVALGSAAAMAAFVTSVPGGRGRWLAMAPIAVLAVWFLLVMIEIASTGGGSVGAGIRCVRNLSVFSVGPGALLYVMLRQAAPLEGGATGLLGALGVAALAQAGTCFVCRNHDAFHFLVWHLACVSLLAAVGALLGRAIFQ